MDQQILTQLIKCLGQHDIFFTAAAQGLDYWELRGSSPAVQLCAENNQNYWGAFDKLPRDQQRKWIRKARNGKAKVRRFWITYFRPLSDDLDMSIHVVDAILTRPIPHSLIPTPDLENQVYGNALLSQIAHLSNYTRGLNAKLLRMFVDPFWYDSDGFRLQTCTSTLFSLAAPTPAFMRMWTRTLVGFAEVSGPWLPHQLDASVNCIGDPLTMHQSDHYDRQVWDTYVVMLASPLISPKLKANILGQIRHSYFGFRMVLPMFFSLTKELKNTSNEGPDDVDPALFFLIEVEERRMKITQQQLNWLYSNAPKSKQRLDKYQIDIQRNGHLVSSQDIFCSWCMEPCVRRKICGRCKGPDYCEGSCQAEAWRAYHKQVCTADVDQHRKQVVLRT